MEPSSLGTALWVKRDDLSGVPLGGNKVRALEFLLGGVTTGEAVLTVGATGSTHALATALYASRLGATTEVHRWPQEMNDAARLVDARLRAAASVHDARWIGAAYLRVALRRMRGRVHWIPAGGTSPLGILGHVDAAFELVDQVNEGRMPRPARVVLPLGSGGTAAGLVLGFALAGLETEVIAVQVVPRVVARAARVRHLARATRRLLERVSGQQLGDAPLTPFRVESAFYGGAYGRELPAGRDAAARFRTVHAGAMLDATYSAKACAAALARCDDRPTLFWLTYDSRVVAG